MREARGRTRNSHHVAMQHALAAGRHADAAACVSRIEATYSTAVDWCPCGTMWCYVCERVMSVSRAQHAAIERSAMAMDRVDVNTPLAPYAPLQPGCNPDPPPVPPSTDPAAASDPAWRAARECARAYWHEAAEHGPWRHTVDWQRRVPHESHVDADPMRSRQWRACPPSMVDLGDLRGWGFVKPHPANGPLSRALAARDNLDIFHATKRRNLVGEVMLHIGRARWIDRAMIAAIRSHLTDAPWDEILRPYGPAWSGVVASAVSGGGGGCANVADHSDVRAAGWLASMEGSIESL